MRLNKLLIAACLTIACTPASFGTSFDDAFKVKSTQPAAGAFARTVKGISTTNDSESRRLIELANVKIAKEPNNDKYYAARAQLHSDLGEFTEALADISFAIKLNKATQIYFEFRAGLKGTLKEYASEVKDLDMALRIGPPRSDLYVKRASALGMVDRYAESLKDANKAVEMDPSSAEAYAIRGTSSYFLHDYKSATADCAKALSLEPTNITAVELRGSLKKVSLKSQFTNRN